jgi:hypothetical protein
VNSQDAHDALLTWCSETGSGSLAGFKAACLHLDLAPRLAARALSELGHVEFDYDAGRYAAAPSALTTIPELPGLLLLTGARPYGLIADLAAAAASSLDIDVSRDLCHQFGLAPSTVLIDADPADAAPFAEAAGIAYAGCASFEISQRLPGISHERTTVAHRPDDRFPHAAIDRHTFQPRWDTAAIDRQVGLWLYKAWGNRRLMIFHNEEEEPRMALDPACAPYLMERDKNDDPIVEYRGAHRLLVVNAAAPLPALHARCACLCSGRIPIRRDTAPGVVYDHYVNVDPQTADRILLSLEAN